MKAIIRNIYLPIVLLLLIQQYVSSEIFWAIGLVLCTYEVFYLKKGRFQIPFREYKILFLFLIWGVMLGVVAYACGNNNLIDIVRDVFYYMNPLIFMFLGANIAKKDISLYRVFNSFIISSAFLCLISMASVIGNLSSLSAIMSVYRWRKIIGDGHFVTSVALAISFAGVIPRDKRLPRLVSGASTAISIVYFILALSRTNIMIAAIMYAVLILQKGNYRKVFGRILGTLLALVLVLVVTNALLPKTISSAFTDKMLSSLTEINATNSFSSEAEIQNNWRGYEASRAVAQWKESDFGKQLIGEGFGARVDVGGYAYTLLGQTINGAPATSVAVLHNGYATQLIKLGVFGVLVYLYFYLAIMRKGIKKRKKKDTLECRVLIAVGLIFLLQTYFLNGLFKDFVFLPTILLIGYSAYKIERGLDYIEIEKE